MGQLTRSPRKRGGLVGRSPARLRQILVLTALLVAALIAAPPAPALAAADVTFGTPTATADFGQGIEFTQPVVLGTSVDRVEVLLTYPGASGPFVVEVPPPGTTGSTTLRYSLDTSGAASLLPNTSITARWRVRASGAESSLPEGPPVTVTYQDTRFRWQTATAGLVRVHWYQGDAGFGQRALSIAGAAIAKGEKALGVTETQPIDFFIYADQTAFREALGPSTGEFVVGRAILETRTLFGLVAPGDIGGSEIGITIAHELTHIVFNTATQNPYHDPPHWLDEGVAKYLSEGYGSSDRGLVSAAASGGTLYPLASLSQAFPGGQAVFLAYAEADAAVDDIVRTHGTSGLARLIDSYATGLTDDEAFKAALGADVAGFDASWFASIGARVPAAAGPSPAPPGPVPPGWGSGGAVASPGAAASTTPGGSVGPAPSADATPVVLGAGVLVLLVVIVLGVGLRARRRPVSPVAPTWAPGIPPGWPSDRTSREDGSGSIAPPWPPGESVAVDQSGSGPSWPASYRPPTDPDTFAQLEQGPARWPSGSDEQPPAPDDESRGIGGPS